MLCGKKRQRVRETEMDKPHWFLLLGAVVFIGNVIYGLKTGKASFAVAPYKRSENPDAYWFAIVFSGVLGVGSLVVFILSLLGIVKG